MEIWNSGCVLDNRLDTNAACWDELLCHGRKVFGVATDDGHAMYHHCNGWVMVNAKNNINSILEALKNGAFYSSCGPEIYNFYAEGNKAIVECSPVTKIRLHSDMHPTKIQKSADGTMTRAEFDIQGGWLGGYKYIRATVIDENGKHAWTNPIFLD